MESIVRLTDINLSNFKNVRNGSLSFINNRKNYKSSVLGLYGQNGSGKTALIDALELLKNLICSREIPSKFADYVNVDSFYSEIDYAFDVKLNKTSFTVIYSVRFTKDATPEKNISDIQLEESTYRVNIIKESLKCQTPDKNGKLRMGVLINTDSTEAFSPKSKYNLLTGGGKEVSTELLVSKKISQKMSKSFIFSRDLTSVIKKNCTEGTLGDNEREEAAHYLALINALIKYGISELFVINTTASGIISLNAQQFMFKIKNTTKENSNTSGAIALPIENPAVIPEDLFAVALEIVKNMNIVLDKIIPGLTIDIKNLGTQLLENNKIGIRIELVSKKNSREIPLKYESEGIKKIVSVLQLLVVVFNQESITVAIDELDSGIFEYLLGELLRVISEKGKGQLIFTSHNLRPLETIDRGFVAFTTTNPDNRYIRMTNIRDTNNLRDFYYRDIILREQDEEVYDTTDNAEITLAFREAGEHLGS